MPRIGGIAQALDGHTPAVAALLTAADLTARGYAVFLPINNTSDVDVVAIDQKGKVETFQVSRARRAGGEVRYDDPARSSATRRALILTDEPVRYRPDMDDKKR